MTRPSKTRLEEALERADHFDFLFTRQHAQDLAAEVRAMRSAVAFLDSEREAASEHLANKDKGGMRVPFHGDFVQVPPSGLSRLRWHTRNILGEK